MPFEPEPEIIAFARSIGATEPEESDEIYRTFRSLFQEHNYFLHPNGFLVVKISRIKKPFWDLTKGIVDFLNVHLSYHVILLKSASQGWAFSKHEVAAYTSSKEWNLDSTGKQYKIHMPLPDNRLFFGPKGCQNLLRPVSGA